MVLQEKRIFIHIGLHKTATTFLQSSFFPRIQNAFVITRPFTQLNRAFNRLQLANDSLYTKEDELEIKTLVESIDAQLIILSDESFEGGPLALGCINRDLIAERFYRLFPNATILIFLRDQIDLIQSYYSQFVRSHRYGFTKFREFVHRPGRNYTLQEYENCVPKDKSRLYFDSTEFSFHPDCLLYTKLVNAYRSRFEKVQVHLFEEMLEEPAIFYGRLAGEMGVRLSGSLENQVQNGRMSERKINRWRIARKFAVLTGFTVSRILSHLVPVFKKVDYDEQTITFLKTYYRKDNRLLKRQLPDLPWRLCKNKYQ